MRFSPSPKLISRLVLLVGLSIAAPIAPGLATPAASIVQAEAPSASQHTPDEADASGDSSSVHISITTSEHPVDAFFEFLVLGVLAGLLFAVVAAFIIGFAAVSIFMDTGCLRFIVFGLGWIPACFTGFISGIILSDLIGWSVLADAGAQLGFFGYPVAWTWGYRRAKQLPREQYVTWQRTLTGGALLGAGVGSVLNLARSAAVLFKGGGGSFGGGGASGSFGSLQTGSAHAGVTAISPSGSSAPAGNALVLGAAGGSATTTSSRVQPASSTPTERSSDTAGLGRRLRHVVRWMRHLRWYHGCAFVLVVLIFVPVGVGAAAWLQDPKTLIFVTAITLAVSLYRWFHRRAAASAPTQHRAPHTDAPFQGGGTSDTW